jgi:tetratricopeptide (TPR) repeat protein
MQTLKSSNDIPDEVKQGLKDGTHQQRGGSIVKLATHIADAGIETAKMFVESGDVHANLRLAEKVVGFVRELPVSGQTTTALMSASPDAQALNLAISTMQFSIIISKLNRIEKKMQEFQEVLGSVNQKLDLTFYAKFKAALDLAGHSFTMQSSENRKSSAWEAIGRFKEAQEFYKEMVVQEVNIGSLAAADYLSSLNLAFVTEVRCYLELNEIPTAFDRLSMALHHIKPHYAQYINTLLTSNPAAYLHPSLKNDIRLSELTKVLNWLDPTAGNEKQVFESLREDIFEVAKNAEAWKKSLPPAVMFPAVQEKMRERSQAKPLVKTLFSSKRPSAFDLKSLNQATQDIFGKMSAEVSRFFPTAEVFHLLVPSFQVIELLIEDCDRLTAYLAEIDTMKNLGMDFHEWQKLKPSEPDVGAGMMYISLT